MYVLHVLLACIVDCVAMRAQFLRCLVCILLPVSALWCFGIESLSNCVSQLWSYITVRTGEPFHIFFLRVPVSRVLRPLTLATSFLRSAAVGVCLLLYSSNKLAIRMTGSFTETTQSETGVLKDIITLWSVLTQRWDIINRIPHGICEKNYSNNTGTGTGTIPSTGTVSFSTNNTWDQ